MRHVQALTERRSQAAMEGCLCAGVLILASACGPTAEPVGTGDDTSTSVASADSSGDTADVSTGASTSGAHDSTDGAVSSTSSGYATTDGGVLCWPNPAWAPEVSFSSPSIRPSFLGLFFTSEAPCTVVESTVQTVSLTCPDPRDSGVVHAIEIAIDGSNTIDLSGLSGEVALAYHDGSGFEACGDGVLRIASPDGQIRLVIAERLDESSVEPLEVELVQTECTEFAAASQFPGSVECRPGALRFSWDDEARDVAEDSTETLQGGLVVDVIRAGRCRMAGAPSMFVDCGTVHFTIVHPSLLASG